MNPPSARTVKLSSAPMREKSTRLFLRLLRRKGGRRGEGRYLYDLEGRSTTSAPGSISGALREPSKAVSSFFLKEREQVGGLLHLLREAWSIFT